MADNRKWFSTLAWAEDNYPEAKKHLELAALTIVEKQLLQDLASTFSLALHKAFFAFVKPESQKML